MAKKYRKIKPAEIEFNRIFGTADSRNQIMIDPSMDQKNVFSTLVHEMLHCFMNHLEEQFDVEDGQLNREDIVLDAERFMVSSIFRLYNIKPNGLMKKCQAAAIEEIKKTLEEVRGKK